MVKLHFRARIRKMQLYCVNLPLKANVKPITLVTLHVQTHVYRNCLNRRDLLRGEQKSKSCRESKEEFLGSALGTKNAKNSQKIRVKPSDLLSIGGG